MMFKYPKFLALLIVILLSVIFFFEAKTYEPLHDLIISLGYFGVFLSGFIYAYAFTAPIATALLLILSEQGSILIAGLLGGAGALISDVLIFYFIRQAFNDEIKLLRREKLVKSIQKRFKDLFKGVSDILILAFAGLLIASPLPTELGVTIMAALKKLSIKKFMIIAYLLHTLGIFTILLIGRLV